MCASSTIMLSGGRRRRSCWVITAAWHCEGGRGLPASCRITADLSSGCRPVSRQPSQCHRGDCREQASCAVPCCALTLLLLLLLLLGTGHMSPIMPRRSRASGAQPSGYCAQVLADQTMS